MDSNEDSQANDRIANWVSVVAQGLAGTMPLRSALDALVQLERHARYYEQLAERKSAMIERLLINQEYWATRR